MEVVFPRTLRRTSKLFSLMQRPLMHPTKIPRVFMLMNLKKKLSAMQLYILVLVSLQWLPSLVALSPRKS